ncbi:MAG: homoserine dehydrogenase [Kiritimatiellae bacterium]|nr:homoserine dehydrogenase [Kiritimatiellia bacterium]
MKQIGVGLLGFGTVGAGVVDGLARNRDLIRTRLGIDVVLRRIGDLDVTTDRGVKVDPSVMTTDAFEVIADPAVDIVVELIGGCGIARKLVMAALEAGKPVVTANKKLLAEFGTEIFDLASKKGVDIYFGASVGGGIPIIRVLREGLAGNAVKNIHGILNGTCNYILTRMEREGLPFDQVLADAQRLGYAEANPALDIDGFDTAHKALILAALSYGFTTPLSSISVEGIRGLDGRDVKFAAELGYRIKLVATVAREGDDIEVYVAPTLVPFSHMLSSVSDAFNAVMVDSDLADKTLYYGRGAGRAPTASTVIGDICDIARNLAAGEVRHPVVIHKTGENFRLRPTAEMRNAFYLRLSVKEQPGSLGCFTSILGKHNVSIASVIQKNAEEDKDGAVPVVAITHVAREADLEAALAEIATCGVVTEAPVRLRILGD